MDLHFNKDVKQTGVPTIGVNDRNTRFHAEYCFKVITL